MCGLLVIIFPILLIGMLCCIPSLVDHFDNYLQDMTKQRRKRIERINKEEKPTVLVESERLNRNTTVLKAARKK